VDTLPGTSMPSRKREQSLFCSPPGAAARVREATPVTARAQTAPPGFGMPGTWPPSCSQPCLFAWADVCVASPPHTCPSVPSTGRSTIGSTRKGCTMHRTARRRIQTAPRRAPAPGGLRLRTCNAPVATEQASAVRWCRARRRAARVQGGRFE